MVNLRINTARIYAKAYLYINETFRRTTGTVCYCWYYNRTGTAARYAKRTQPERQREREREREAARDRAGKKAAETS